MTGYIIDPWENYISGDGQTPPGINKRLMVDVISYDIPMDGITSETGTIMVLGRLMENVSYRYLKIIGYDKLWYITAAVTSTDKTTTLTVKSWAGAFDSCYFFNWYHHHEYAGMPSTYSYANFGEFFVGEFASGGVWGNYGTGPSTSLTQGAHGRWRPYNVHGASLTTDSEVCQRLANLDPQTSDICEETEYMISMPKLIEYIRKAGVDIVIDSYSSPRYGGTDMYVHFETIDFDSAQNVVVGNGHTEILTESFEDDICTTVYIFFVYKLPGGANTASVLGFVQNEDGEVVVPFSSSAPTPFYSATGVGYAKSYYDDSQIYTTSSYTALAATLAPIAESVFAQNSSSHKIEFASDKEFKLFQPIKIQTSRGVLDTAISSIRIKSDDNRYIYTCGDLPTTATDNIRANKWKYGQRLPNNPRKGQFFILT